MSARTPRRRFAQPLVITLASAAGLAACGGAHKDGEYDRPHPNPPPMRTDAAMWRVDTVAPDTCVVAPCRTSEADCGGEQVQPYPCVTGHSSVVIIRHEGEYACAYNGAPPYVEPNCPPEISCNPPPQQWEPITLRCPDAE
jgi:hypothetical protein